MLLRRPREFPGALLEAFRRGFRRVFRARGGGLYATGFFVTFAWLELTMLLDDLASSTGAGGFFAQQLTELFLRYTVESLQNTVQALLWPLFVVAYRPPWGLVLLVAMYYAFPLMVKKPLERWLFGDVADEPAEAGGTESATDEKEGSR